MVRLGAHASPAATCPRRPCARGLDTLRKYKRLAENARRGQGRWPWPPPPCARPRNGEDFLERVGPRAGDLAAGDLRRRGGAAHLPGRPPQHPPRGPPRARGGHRRRQRGAGPRDGRPPGAGGLREDRRAAPDRALRQERSPLGPGRGPPGQTRRGGAGAARRRGPRGRLRGGHRDLGHDPGPGRLALRARAGAAPGDACTTPPCPPTRSARAPEVAGVHRHQGAPQGPRPGRGARRHHRAGRGPAGHHPAAAGRAASSSCASGRCGRGSCSTTSTATRARWPGRRPIPTCGGAAWWAWPSAASTTRRTRARWPTLALALFDGTRQRHGLGDSERSLLEYAALLHDVGHHISLSRPPQTHLLPDQERRPPRVHAPGGGGAGQRRPLPPPRAAPAEAPGLRGAAPGRARTVQVLSGDPAAGGRARPQPPPGGHAASTSPTRRQAARTRPR